MDRYLPHHHEPDPSRLSGDSASPPDGADADEPVTETLMEALAEVITVDPETGHVEGCANDFRLTETVLARHHQEHVAAQVLDLLRAQGAMCDCEVLLNSGIDLVFLENDIEYEEDEEDAEGFEDELAT